jgi:hypothetical protein
LGYWGKFPVCPSPDLVLKEMMIQSHLTLGLTAQLEQQVLKEWSFLIIESQKTILQEYRQGSQT